MRQYRFSLMHLMLFITAICLILTIRQPKQPHILEQNAAIEFAAAIERGTANELAPYTSYVRTEVVCNDLGWKIGRTHTAIDFSDEADLWRAEVRLYIGTMYVDGLSPPLKKVRNKQLRHLPKLENLRLVGLSRTAVTDRCLRFIGQLQHLEVLHVDGTLITGHGLSTSLPNLDNLVELQLDEGMLDRELLDRLSRSKQLQRLRIDLAPPPSDEDDLSTSETNEIQRLVELDRAFERLREQNPDLKVFTFASH